jgi:3-hydroxyacyl-CoA dehydrogenase
MAADDIRRVAAIGTGTIGASWTAVFLAHGLTVAASDPAPGAETFLRGFVAAAWPSLARLSPLPAGLSFLWQRQSRTACKVDGPKRALDRAEALELVVLP